MALVPRRNTSNVQVMPLAPQGRRIRRPQHTFNLVTKPWQIQPFCLAPVLPGETLRNLVWQARVVTDPVANPLVGWWNEYYWFYVKLRDFDNRDLMEAMVVDPEFDPASIGSETANAKYYFNGRGQVPWASMCLKKVTEEFFRYEDELASDFMVDGMPAATINNANFTDSLTAEADMEQLDVDIDAGSDDVLQVSELNAAMRQWELLQMSGLVDMDYETFLAQYGVRPQQVVTEEELFRPELVRYVRSWQYPSNTVNPEDGSVASAVSWSVAERADKDRFFKEPGFLFGVTVCRPKVYMGNLGSSAANVMNTLRSWLPPWDMEMNKSFIPVPGDGGPLTVAGEGYWLDVKDLLEHGDQFMNHAGAPKVALPASADFQRRYPLDTDVAALFAGSAQTVRQDGVATMMIATAQGPDKSAPRNRTVTV